jgi:hypothetical protein
MSQCRRGIEKSTACQSTHSTIIDQPLLASAHWKGLFRWEGCNLIPTEPRSSNALIGLSIFTTGCQYTVVDSRLGVPMQRTKCRRPPSTPLVGWLSKDQRIAGHGLCQKHLS